MLYAFLFDIWRSDSEYFEGQSTEHPSVGSAAKFVFAYNHLLSVWENSAQHIESSDEFFEDTNFAYFVTSGGVDVTVHYDYFNTLQEILSQYKVDEEGCLFVSFKENGKIVEWKKIIIDNSSTTKYILVRCDGIKDILHTIRRPIVVHMSEGSLYDVRSAVFRLAHEFFHKRGERRRDYRAKCIIHTVCDILANYLVDILPYKLLKERARQLFYSRLQLSKIRDVLCGKHVIEDNVDTITSEDIGKCFHFDLDFLRGCENKLDSNGFFYLKSERESLVRLIECFAPNDKKKKLLKEYEILLRESKDRMNEFSKIVLEQYDVRIKNDYYKELLKIFYSTCDKLLHNHKFNPGLHADILFSYILAMTDDAGVLSQCAASYKKYSEQLADRLDDIKNLINEYKVLNHSCSCDENCLQTIKNCIDEFTKRNLSTGAFKMLNFLWDGTDTDLVDVRYHEMMYNNVLLGWFMECYADCMAINVINNEQNNIKFIEYVLYLLFEKRGLDVFFCTSGIPLDAVQPPIDASGYSLRLMIVYNVCFKSKHFNQLMLEEEWDRIIEDNFKNVMFPDGSRDASGAVYAQNLIAYLKRCYEGFTEFSKSGYFTNIISYLENVINNSANTSLAKEMYKEIRGLWMTDDNSNNREYRDFILSNWFAYIKGV